MIYLTKYEALSELLGSHRLLRQITPVKLGKISLYRMSDLRKALNNHLIM